MATVPGTSVAGRPRDLLAASFNADLVRLKTAGKQGRDCRRDAQALANTLLRQQRCLSTEAPVSERRRHGPAESATGTVSTVSLLRHDLGRMSADHRRGRHRGDRTALGHLEPGRSRARGRQGSRVHVTNGRQPAAGTTSFMPPRSQSKSHTACGQPQKTSPQTPAKTLPGNMDARSSAPRRNSCSHGIADTG